MSRAVATLLFVAIAFTFTAPATASSASTQDLTQPAADTGTETAAAANTAPVASGDKLGFVDRYFPLRLPNDLEPEVERNVVLIWVLSITLAPCWSSLWAPAMLTGQGLPDGFFADLLVSGLLHFATHFIPFVGAVIAWANCLYLCPVATIAIYDRNLKRERGKRVTAGSSPPDDESRSALAILPVTNMAY